MKINLGVVRSGRGTREAILSLRQILEKRIEINENTYIAFVDLEKAFVKVDWKLLFESLKNAGLDWRDRKLILNLYKNQTTLIDVNGGKREAVINGEQIHSIRFADDIVLVTESEEDLNNT
uniref:Reverse transcriptase domain-containing protein n=1 Tax=Cacopsylla melanoneura TaxID=428564 RepID=A0A8D8VCQ7_9HEMI